jgi:hypothetical protein
MYIPEEYDDELYDTGDESQEVAKSGIHIKAKNKGKFNATKKKTGKTTAQLTHSSNPKTKERAIFAQNASKWSKKRAEWGADMWEDPIPNHDREYHGIDEGPSRFSPFLRRMYADDGVSVPGLQYPQQSPQLNSQQQQDSQNMFTTKIDQQPANLYTGKLTPPKKEKDNNFNPFATATTALGFASEFLHPPRPRPFIARPQMAYNPDPKGEGGNAMFEDGGYVRIMPGGGTVPGDVQYEKGKITGNSKDVQINSHYKPVINPDGIVYSTDRKRQLGMMTPGAFHPNTHETTSFTPDEQAWLHYLSVSPNSNPQLNSWNDNTYGRGNINVDKWTQDMSQPSSATSNIQPLNKAQPIAQMHGGGSMGGHGGFGGGMGNMYTRSSGYDTDDYEPIRKKKKKKNKPETNKRNYSL